MESLFRKKPTYRSANGRFRRQTREDMNWFEQMNHDAMIRQIDKIVADIQKPNAFMQALASPAATIGRTIRIRLPSDFKVEDRTILPIKRID